MTISEEAKLEEQKECAAGFRISTFVYLLQELRLHHLMASIWAVSVYLISLQRDFQTGTFVTTQRSEFL